MEKKRKRKSVTPTPPPTEAVVVSEPVVEQGAQTAQAVAPAQPPEPAPSAEAEPEAAPESAPRQKVAKPVAPVAESAEAAEAADTEAPAKPKAKKKKKKVTKKRVSKAPASVEVAAAPDPEAAAPSAESAAPEAASREVLDDKLDKLEAKLEEKKEEVARAAREGFASDPGVEDTSVPPVDLDAHDDFFSAGEKAHHQKATGASGSFDAIDPKTLRKMTAEAHARRAHLSRYVKWAVGGAAALLLLGFVVKTLRGRPADEPVVRHEVVHTAQVAPPPVEQPKPAAAAAAAAGTQIEELDQPKADEPKPAASADDNKAVDDEKKADDDKATANADNEKKDEPLVDKPKTAWQEKQAAKAALERGANGAAVAAGERAVGLDSSDAEAWLVLGGAYQAMGNIGQAKRCYKACVAQGKKGPVGDCRDMLGSL
jgi:tetratricopeptide (TPR) repeat protein